MLLAGSIPVGDTFITPLLPAKMLVGGGFLVFEYIAVNSGL
nr:MAG TPA: hypothetical protein [Caudoviricetes sp.]